MSKAPIVLACLLLSVALLAAVGGCTLFRPTEAVIHVDTTSGTVPLTISFDGTASIGPDGISTYHWGFGTEDESSDPTGTYTYQQAGTFTLTLMVRSHDGKTDTATVTIVVEPAIWITDGKVPRCQHPGTN